MELKVSKEITCKWQSHSSLINKICLLRALHPSLLTAKMNLRKLLGQQGFKTVKCNSFQSSSRLSVCTFLLYLPCSLYFQGCALHCSRAWWPLVPNFCSWASRKSYKSYAGHLGFYRFRALSSLQFFLEQSLDFLLMFWSFIFMFHSTWWQFLCFTM